MSTIPDIDNMLYTRRHHTTTGAKFANPIAISLPVSIMRDHLRQEVRAIKDDEDGSKRPTYDKELAELQDWLPNTVEITGLELLLSSNTKGSKSLLDDCSYESYAVDSHCLIGIRVDGKEVVNNIKDQRMILRRQVSDISNASRERPQSCSSDEGSYAGDSVCLNHRRIANDHMIGRGHDGAAQTDHMKPGAIEKPRRLPISSYSDRCIDSVGIDGGASVDYVKDSVHLQRISSSKPPRANPGKLREGIKRTASGTSCSFFSLEVYESQTISGGASRAA